MRPTIMKISTDAVAANARAIRARIPEKVRMMCVVKADAYGHDSVRTAKKLLAAGADAFAVAIVEEAEALRRGGIDSMILVLGGAGEDSLRRAVRAGVSQAVYTPRMLEIMQDEAARCGRRALAHLKIDTGMSRIGVRGGDDLSAMLAWWRRCPDVEMEGVFTHFCVATPNLPRCKTGASPGHWRRCARRALTPSPTRRPPPPCWTRPCNTTWSAPASCSTAAACPSWRTN